MFSRNYFQLLKKICCARALSLLEEANCDLTATSCISSGALDVAKLATKEGSLLENAVLLLQLQRECYYLIRVCKSAALKLKTGKDCDSAKKLRENLVCCSSYGTTKTVTSREENLLNEVIVNLCNENGNNSSVSDSNN